MPQRSIQCVLASLASQHQARPVSIALYHCAAHCCVFTVNNPPPTPPHPWHSPTTPSHKTLYKHTLHFSLLSHANRLCWVFVWELTRCSGTVGQSSLFVDPGYVLHPRQLFVTGFFLRRHKLPFFFLPLKCLLTPGINSACVKLGERIVG